MLALSIKFPGGRYHATPWGRHVNEADLEWPPSPWRITRALIAVWHRKLAPFERNVALLTRLLQKLASELPHYQIPDAVHAHTRHYMPGKGDKRTLVFDAFARLDADDPVIALWPSAQFTDEEIALLDTLLSRLGFLGRAESWAEAERIPAPDCELNCIPEEGDGGGATDESHERLTLLAPLQPEEYLLFSKAQRAGIEKRADLRAIRRAIEDTLPVSWLDAVSSDTTKLRAAGWSAPPAARSISYLRPAGTLRPIARQRRERVEASVATTFRFSVYGRPLPRIEDAVRVGERLRVAVMSCVKRACGEDVIPAVISGHGLAAENRHQHAFWLSEDSDGDGRIDHLVVHVPAGISDATRTVVESLSRLWNRDGQEWHLVLEAAAAVSKCADFVSTTPYMMPWHEKANLGLEAQIRRECVLRGLPSLLSVEEIPSVRVAGRRRRPIDFHRFRSKRGVVQPDRRGAFVRIVFSQSVQGPLALGFGCHFGLGMFAPAAER